MADNLELFQSQIAVRQGAARNQDRPLADRLRPADWSEFQGLEQLDRNLVEQLRHGRGRPPSLILWGPPGSGKTTLAKLIGNSFDCYFVEFSAVLGGVKDVRQIIEQARKLSQQTVLFVDEIHRFNKAQQDAFLPHVENGIIVLIGATTENPSFYLNSALLSRTRVIPLPELSGDQLQEILIRGLRQLELNFEESACQLACEFVGGDARRLLNLLESFTEAQVSSPGEVVEREKLEEFLRDSNTAFYDRDGEEHYNMASAFIKSMRGSDPDASLYWGFRMLESGEDPRFLLRRMMIFASEDIGNADPRALQLAVSTTEAFEKIGFPEGRIPIAHCITYLASAPKSNRSYVALNRVLAKIKEHPKIAVPLHLRNAPTDLMKSMGYGSNYQYPHDHEGGFVDDEQYLPDELVGEKFYQPAESGYEKRLAEHLRNLKSSD